LIFFKKIQKEGFKKGLKIEVDVETGQLKGVPKEWEGIVGGTGTQYIDTSDLDENLKKGFDSIVAKSNLYFTI
jgi:hypothetical protein